MNILKQSTAATIKFGPLIDDSDGKTAETALTISQADIRLSKNGGDFAQTNNASGATHDENGYYDIPLDITDTGTLGRLRVAVSKSGALPIWQDFLIVTANVYDSLVGGSDKLDVNAAEIADDAIKASTFDETTAFPLKSADTGSTQVARVGADSDTLEILSDQLDAIVEDTGTTIPAAITGLNDIAVSDIMNEVVVGTYTFEQLLKVMSAALAGKLSGGGTATLIFRGIDDTSDVIVATIDANNNRTAVTLDLT